MLENHIRILCAVIKVDLVYEAPGEAPVAFFDSIQDSILVQSPQLRETLRSHMGSQHAPYLHPGQDGVFYAVLHAGEGLLYMGPMCSERLTPGKRRQMYNTYGIDSEKARVLPVFSRPEIRNMVLLTNSALRNGNLQHEELLHLNQIIRQNETGILSEQTQFLLKEEAENDDASYRHSYHEERLLMHAIREGRTEDAVRLAESMDADSGRLSDQERGHRKNLAIIGIALCTRAAIEGGISPEEGYRLSGYYIKKCDNAQDMAHLLHYRNRAIEDMTTRVRERIKRPHCSGNVERCKDYIRKHYREKIYLEEIAETLHLSPTYLSKLFKKETGQCLQDYVNEERVFRAANLLMYSDLSLSEIAEYVHFPTQSYFGKIFKQFKNMTPKAYRDRFRSTEALEQETRNHR